MMSADKEETKVAKEDLERRVEKLEQRLNALLNGKTELEVIEIKTMAIAPRSKLRLQCE